MRNEYIDRKEQAVKHVRRILIDLNFTVCHPLGLFKVNTYIFDCKKNYFYPTKYSINNSSRITMILPDISSSI